jgi:hypothetical protein
VVGRPDREEDDDEDGDGSGIAGRILKKQSEQ